MRTRARPGNPGVDTQAAASAFVSLPVRGSPGVDLRRALEQVVAEHGAEAGFVLAGIGSP